MMLHVLPVPVLAAGNLALAIKAVDYSALQWGAPTSGNPCTTTPDHRVRWELNSTPAGWTVTIEFDKDGGGWNAVVSGLSLTNGSPAPPWTGQYNHNSGNERDTEAGAPQVRKYRVTLKHATKPDVGPIETNTQTSIGDITACLA